MSDGDEWFMKVDKKTGAPYYYNRRGDVSYTPPPGFQSPSPQQQQQAVARVRKTSWLGGGSAQPVRLDRTAAGAGAGDGGRPRRQRRLTNRPNPALAGAGIGEKRGTVLRALYGHVARFEDELTVRPGTYLVGVRKVEGGNWWLADYNGREGHIPANYVEVVDDPEDSLGGGDDDDDAGSAGTAANPVRRPSKRPSAGGSSLNGSDYGASSSGWFQAGAAAPPMRPPKPAALVAKQKPRDVHAMLRDELAQNRGGSALKWTYLAHTWGYAFGLYALLLGAFALHWHAEALAEVPTARKRLLLGSEEQWSGFVVMGCGLLALVLEYTVGLYKSNAEYNALGGFSLRPWLYVAMSVPCFFSYASVLAGAVGLVAAALNLAADWNDERGEGKAQKFVPSVSRRKVAAWSSTEVLVVGGFLFVNLALFVYRFAVVATDREDCLAVQPLGERCDTIWAAFAKGFGTSLDLTCALVLLPVLRATVNHLSNLQLSPTPSVASRLPVKKSMAFHKVIAYSIVVGSVGHIAFHLLNFGENPVRAIDHFGAAALWTGGGITLGMTIIFCAAHSSVRKSNYEAFWYSHHAFVIVFPLLLAHAPKFWYAAVLMLPLYLADRAWRVQRGTHPMYVDFVKFSPPVLRLHFFPERVEHLRFQEGQYVFVQVPHVNGYEWHPFTISSAFGDLERDGYASLHIRVQAPGSWTWRVKEYFQLLAGAGNAKREAGVQGPLGDPSFESFFTHFDPSGVVRRGKYFGVDGKPLIRVDGPHAAPAQLYSGFEDVMLVGSGIGLTPSSAILSAVTRHKWRKGFRPETLRFYWVVRHAELGSFTWFTELLVDISKQVLADRRTNAVTDRHRLQINVYVTSVPSSVQVFDKAVPGPGTAPGRARSGSADIGFTLQSLSALLREPRVAAREQLRLQGKLDAVAQSKLPNVLGDIFVWNGRPAWEQVFNMNKEGRRERVAEVGVTYCGAPPIAEALKDYCKEFSDDQCKFVLNKEVF